MSKKSSKDQPAPAPQNPKVPGAESAELQAALAEFRSILEKEELPLKKNEEVGSEKPGH